MKPRGILIAEAVVASFLMLFAFAAAAALFDAALRWESDSGNYRKAGLVAERKMEELRAQASDIGAGGTFAGRIDGLIGGPHPDYLDAPGFTITVTSLPNRHLTIPANGLTPSDGVHSPCSTFFTAPGPPGAPHPFDPNGDHQRNRTYATYPFSRPMPQSYRLRERTHPPNFRACFPNRRPASTGLQRRPERQQFGGGHAHRAGRNTHTVKSHHNLRRRCPDSERRDRGRGLRHLEHHPDQHGLRQTLHPRP